MGYDLIAQIYMTLLHKETVGGLSKNQTVVQDNLGRLLTKYSMFLETEVERANELADQRNLVERKKSE